MFSDPVTFRPHRAPESVIEKRHGAGRHGVHGNAQQVHVPRTSTPTQNPPREFAGSVRFGSSHLLKYLCFTHPRVFVQDHAGPGDEISGRFVGLDYTRVCLI